MNEIENALHMNVLTPDKGQCLLSQPQGESRRLRVWYNVVVHLVYLLDFSSWTFMSLLQPLTTVPWHISICQNLASNIVLVDDVNTCN